jgi:HEAT repeat protein
MKRLFNLLLLLFVAFSTAAGSERLQLHAGEATAFEPAKENVSPGPGAGGAENTSAASLSAPIAAPKNEALAKLVQAAFSDSDYPAAQEAWREIGKIATPQDLPLLLPIMHNSQDIWKQKLATQGVAMAALTQIGKKEGGVRKFVEHFTNMRLTASPICKMRMIEVLKNLDLNEGRNFLASLIDDPSPAVQVAAIRVLDYSDSPHTLRLLNDLLSTPDLGLKKETMLALGRSKDLASAPKFIAFLDDKEPSVRDSARYALRNITGRNFDSSTLAKLWWDAEQNDSEENFKVLVEQLKNGPPQLAPLAIEELGKCVLQRDRVHEVLLPCLASFDFRVRAAACGVLGEMPASPKLLNTLVATLQDQSEIVAATAWRSLKHLTGQKLPNQYPVWSEWFQNQGGIFCA